MHQGNFAHYQVLDILGTGGTAVVYRAVDQSLDRIVALKILHSKIDVGSREARRFEREAQIIQRLRHPQIIEIYDYGWFNGLGYLAMEYMPGGSLAQRFRQPTTLSLEESVDILVSIATALDYAHAQGVLHRDLKLDNILVSAGATLKLGDFGLARINEFARITTTGNIVGTPVYMSPEQVQGLRNVDVYSDIYSFAVIAYLLATGYFPFTDPSDLVVMQKHLAAIPPLPSNLNPRLPPGIDRVLLKGLAKNPTSRFQTAGALVQAFRDAISHHADTDIVVLTTQPTPLVSSEPVSLVTSPSATVRRTSEPNQASEPDDIGAAPRRWRLSSIFGIAGLAVLVVMAMFQVVREGMTSAAPTAAGIQIEIVESVSPSPWPIFTSTPSATSSTTRTETRTPSRTPSMTSSATRMGTRRPSRTPTRTAVASPSAIAARETMIRTTAAAIPSAVVPTFPVGTNGPPLSVPATSVPSTFEPPTDVPPSAAPSTDPPPTVPPPTDRSADRPAADRPACH
ncbi:MAG: protein kinase [Chloroflexi bacterium]|nr:protein kinase [Chloroflexota bacterium]